MHSHRGDVNFTLILWVLAALLLVAALIFPFKLKEQGKSIFDLVTFGKDPRDSSSETHFAEEDISEETTLRIERLKPNTCCYYDLIKLEEDKGWRVTQERSYWFDATLSQNLHLEEIFTRPDITGRLLTYYVRSPNQAGWFFDVNRNGKKDGVEVSISAQELATVVTRSYAGSASFATMVASLSVGKAEFYPLTLPSHTAFFVFSSTDAKDTKIECTRPANYDGRLTYSFVLQKPESCGTQACACTCSTEVSQLLTTCTTDSLSCTSLGSISYVQSAESTSWSGRGIVDHGQGTLEIVDERALWTCSIPLLVGDDEPYPLFLLKQTDTVLKLSN